MCSAILRINFPRWWLRINVVDRRNFFPALHFCFVAQAIWLFVKMVQQVSSNSTTLGMRKVFRIYSFTCYLLKFVFFNVFRESNREE